MANPSSSHSVLFLNHWAKSFGGAEYSLLDILDHGASRAPCHLVTTETGPLLDKARLAGAAIYVVKCGRLSARRNHLLAGLIFSPLTILRFSVYLLRLRILVNQIRPSCIHANVPKSHIAALLLGLMGCRIPIILHLREIFGQKSVAVRLYQVLAMFQFRISIITISRAVFDALPPSLQKHATLIYNGISIPVKQSRPYENRPFRFLYLGRIVPWKGCHNLIRIFAQVKRIIKIPVSFSLVGDARYWSQEYPDFLNMLIQQLGIADSCRLHPHASNIDNVFADHDVFCTASDNEPFGRSVAEAQAAGLPVVAYASGGIPEIVLHDRTGILLPPDDSRAFANAMVRLVQNPDMVAAFGAAGRTRMEQFFNREIQIPSIWEKIISGQPKG